MFVFGYSPECNCRSRIHENESSIRLYKSSWKFWDIIYFHVYFNSNNFSFFFRIRLIANSLGSMSGILLYKSYYSLLNKRKVNYLFHTSQSFKALTFLKCSQQHSHIFVLLNGISSSFIVLSGCSSLCS